MKDLPELALSVRQPWAFAILHLGKHLENRGPVAIQRGGMKRARICLHAAQGMTREEYENALKTFERAGVPREKWPLPDALPRGGLVGVMTIVDVINKSTSPWFFGPKALVIEDPVAIDPIPCSGALGYFKWSPEPDGALKAPAGWMRKWRCAQPTTPTPLRDRLL